jgi:hypothetical protein
MPPKAKAKAKSKAKTQKESKSKTEKPQKKRAPPSEKSENSENGEDHEIEQLSSDNEVFLFFQLVLGVDFFEQRFLRLFCAFVNLCTSFEF